jgi:lantibiotic transport system permease protein
LNIDKILKQTAMKALLIPIQIELLKIRRTPVFYLILSGAALIPIVIFIILLVKSQHFIVDTPSKAWQSQTYRTFQSVSTLLIPSFIVLFTALLNNIEQKALAWKQLLTYPVESAKHYFFKLLTAVLLVIATFILFNLYFLFFTYLVGIIKPGLLFATAAPDWVLLFKINAKAFIATLGILGIQFWLSAVIKNFIWPISIGIGMVIAGLIIMRWKYAIYIPYNQNMFAFSEAMGEMQINHWFKHIAVTELWSVGIFILFSIGGYFHFKRIKW